ncbi:hypothetical protein SynWH8101_2423 [Synechococcus sp. WH 8101]|jgi:hypothetical protein|uniref:hypothetical protein n=1 Tax=Synechococcus sp. WH 8101 TaxID=59932 RepID=UPI00102350A0|nr:hypothetical protein [Synechococcus sp. WH 8101]QBE69997.1 hypothetical protein SynWH8101_2423 [Synechococcus sp. WH 8101]QNI46262.1 putative conserved secreted protein [Synechococcus sp. WH 8101]
MTTPTLIRTGAAGLLGLMTLVPLPLRAQSNGALPLAQPKAANLARMRAEALNGGLSLYRADQCMYETGAPACLLSKTQRGFLFRFQGGAPGWQQSSPPDPSLETEVLVSPNGDQILAVPYNGPIR